MSTDVDVDVDQADVRQPGAGGVGRETREVRDRYEKGSASVGCTLRPTMARERESVRERERMEREGAP